MADEKKPAVKPKLQVLNFPKAPETAQEAEMGFDILHLQVKSEDSNRVIEFLNNHAGELPVTPQNLLALVWTATRSLIMLGIPGEIAGIMVQRACTWVPDQTSPPGNVKPPLPQSKRKKL